MQRLVEMGKIIQKISENFAVGNIVTSESLN